MNSLCHSLHLFHWQIQLVLPSKSSRLLRLFDTCISSKPPHLSPCIFTMVSWDGCAFHLDPSICRTTVVFSKSYIKSYCFSFQNSIRISHLTQNKIWNPLQRLRRCYVKSLVPFSDFITYYSWTLCSNQTSLLAALDGAEPMPSKGPLHSLPCQLSHSFHKVL